MTHTENFLDTQYQYAWVSEAHEIHWKELEIFNRISDIDMEGTAYGNIRHTFDKVIGKYHYICRNFGQFEGNAFLFASSKWCQYFWIPNQSHGIFIRID